MMRHEPPLVSYDSPRLPDGQGQTSLGGISKKPWTKSDLEMARGLLTALAPLQCGVSH